MASDGGKVISINDNYRSPYTYLRKNKLCNPTIIYNPPTTYAKEGSPLKIPSICKDLLYHKVSLGVIISQDAKNVAEDSAMDYVAGYCLVLDMTAREYNNATVDEERFEVSKYFAVSEFVPCAKIVDPHNVNLWCNVNGAVRQKGNTKDMIFSIPHLISFFSQYFTLEPNDIILTGTPSGVGPVKDGDTIEAGLTQGSENVRMSFKVEN